MHARSFNDLNVPAIVVQMDQITWALKSALEKSKSSTGLMFTPGTAQAVVDRWRAIEGLIRELDVGGAGRQHVFFPLPGQTSDQAWATYREVAESARQSLMQLGQFISTWSMSPTLARIGETVKQEFKADVSALVLVVGGLVALNLLQQIGSTRRAFSGAARYRRRRRR